MGRLSLPDSISRGRLKLIIMSATLRVTDFTQNPVLFPFPPPVLNVPSRQYPVVTHFSRVTAHDYVNKALQKVARIHTRLPPGGILVFLTGRQEIEQFCTRLRGIFKPPTEESRKAHAAQLEIKRKVGKLATAPSAAAGTGAGSHRALPDLVQRTNIDGNKRYVKKGQAFTVEELERDDDEEWNKLQRQAEATTAAGNTASGSKTSGNKSSGKGKTGCMTDAQTGDAAAAAGDATKTEGEEEEEEDAEQFELSDDGDYAEDEDSEVDASSDDENDDEDGDKKKHKKKGKGGSDAEDGDDDEDKHGKKKPKETAAEKEGKKTNSVSGSKWEEEADRLRAEAEKHPPMTVLPLYALLPTEQQMVVFAPETHNQGARVVVVATNVAETSITIPGIRYVVDSGREKSKVYDNSTGSSHFAISFVSQASSNQRSGRAGRTGPGHSYRLFSSAVFTEHFPVHTEPEILRQPIDATVLQMKSMGIRDILSFPFPSPPSLSAVQLACHSLYVLGALKQIPMARRKPYIPPASTSTSTTTTALSSADTRFCVHGREFHDVASLDITDIGRAMSLFPLHPRYAKILLTAVNQPGCLPLAVTVTSAMTVNELFMKPEVLRLSMEREEKDEDDGKKSMKDGEVDDDADDEEGEEEEQDDAESAANRKSKPSKNNRERDDYDDGDDSEVAIDSEDEENAKIAAAKAAKKKRELALKEARKAEYKVCGDDVTINMS